MQVALLRRGSLGIQGTYQNLHHHALPLLPLVKYLEKKIPTLGFACWRQGHNVHVLETEDGRKFVLRPFSRKGVGYLGITLSAKVSRSHEIHLVTLWADQRDLTFANFALALRLLAQPQPLHEQLSDEDHAVLAETQSQT